MNEKLTSLEQLRMAAERSKALSAQVAAAAADAIGEMEEGLSGKQDKLTGTQGQIVGFDAAGNAVAQDAPAGAGFPFGGIIIWSGAANAIPAGWALCDGTNGTPDLRDRFVLGAGNKYVVGATGGEETHKLTSGELAAHIHQLEYMSTMSPTGIEGHGDYNVPSVPNTGNSTIDINYTLIESDDGISRGVPHNNMPPYYALCYIIKVTAGPNDCVTMKEVNEAISAAITGAMEASY